MISLFKNKMTPEEIEDFERRAPDPDNFPTEAEYIRYAKQVLGFSKSDALNMMSDIQSLATKARYGIE